MPKYNYYAVRCGRNIGIFDNYNDYQNSMNGWSGANGSGFFYYNEAVDYMNESDSDNDNDSDSINIDPNQTYQLYSDGASRGNPGLSGCGGYILNESTAETIIEYSEYIGDYSTNNIAEYRALIIGLQRAVQLGIQFIECYTDSGLIVNQIRRRWRVNKTHLLELRTECDELIANFQLFRIYYIPRERNRRADRLANIAINENQLFGDYEYCS